MFGFTVVPVFINRNPIDSFTGLIRPVGIAFVMLQVNAFVENLAKPNGHRFHDAERTIEQRGPEVRIMDEVVGNAVDVPGDAD